MAAKADLSNAASEIEAFFERKALNTAPAWMPEPGTVMQGTVFGIRMGADNGYGTYPVVIYKLDDGKYVSVHAFHTLLRNQLKEIGTKVGARHILSYDGKKRKNKATQEEIDKGLADYHNYYIEDADAAAAASAQEVSIDDF